jgi:hypothetical protein
VFRSSPFWVPFAVSAGVALVLALLFEAARRAHRQRAPPHAQEQQG